MILRIGYYILYIALLVRHLFLILFCIMLREYPFNFEVGGGEAMVFWEFFFCRQIWWKICSVSDMDRKNILRAIYALKIVFVEKWCCNNLCRRYDTKRKKYFTHRPPSKLNRCSLMISFEILDDYSVFLYHVAFLRKQSRFIL